MEACHNDGNPENNNVENLRWDTHHNNIIDKLKHGTIARKEKHGCAVLTEVQVVEIRKKWASGGYRQRDLADEYGVVQANIYYIVHGKTWKTSTNQEKS